MGLLVGEVLVGRCGELGMFQEKISPCQGPCDVREAAWEIREACEICQKFRTGLSFQPGPLEMNAGGSMVEGSWFLHAVEVGLPLTQTTEDLIRL